MATENVNHPNHYGGGENPFEIIKVLNAWQLEWKLANVIKYCARAGKKTISPELEDLKKARFYLDNRIQELENEKPVNLFPEDD